MEKQSINIVMLGHLDHGKSTLIGRLLLDTGSLPEMEITELAYVADQLKEERERDATLDTTQVLLKTPRKNYVLIDTPGSAHLIRNMITGATQAEAAVLLVDAAEGAMEQTRRHAYIAKLVGIDTVLLVVNKMDLVDYKQDIFSDVRNAILAFLEDLGIEVAAAIPISARAGDNVSKKSSEMNWYEGLTLLEALEGLEVSEDIAERPLRFPIQDVYEMDKERIIVGRVVSGMLRESQDVIVCPSMEETRVDSIRIFDGTKREALAGENIGLTLAGSSRAECGDVIAEKNDPPNPATSVRANVFWMSDEPLRKNEPLTFRCATQKVDCAAESIHERINSSTLEVIDTDAAELCANEAGIVTLKTAKPVVLEKFSFLRELGRFVIENRDNMLGVGIVTERL